MTHHNLAHQIVEALGASAWVCAPTDQETVAIIERCDGLRLRLTRCDARGWHDVDGKRIAIRPVALEAPDERGQPVRYDYAIPSITVSAQRSATSIAGDIRNRLMPEAESWFAAALLWQQRVIALHSALSKFRKCLLAFPNADRWQDSRKVYGRGWTCDLSSVSSCDLAFDGISHDLAVALLGAYHQIIEEPMPDHQQTNQQAMFPAGDDLPVFSGSPVRVAARRFDPKPEPGQPSMFDLRPAFGGDEPAYTPRMAEADKGGAA